MTRTGSEAVAYANSRVGGTMHASGYCLMFTRTCFDIASRYASAIDAWNAASHPHALDRNPPAAVPVWFWSSSIYRHVAFHCGNGRVVTTFNAEIRAYSSLAAMESVFGRYMGWAEDLNGVRVYGEETVVADLDKIESDVAWIKSRLGGSTSGDTITKLLRDAQDYSSTAASNSTWVKSRLGGSAAEGSDSITTLLRGMIADLAWQTVRIGTDEGTPAKSLAAELVGLADRLTNLADKIDALELGGGVLPADIVADIEAAAFNSNWIKTRIGGSTQSGAPNVTNQLRAIQATADGIAEAVDADVVTAVYENDEDQP